MGKVFDALLQKMTAKKGKNGQKSAFFTPLEKPPKPYYPKYI